MSRRLPTTIALTLLAALAAALAAGAGAAVSSPGGGRGFAPRQVVVKFEGQRFGRAVPLPPRVGVREAAGALRRSPRVAYAVPNYIATASVTTAPNVAAASVATRSAKAAVTTAGLPNDPGNIAIPRDPPGAWVSKQWNFLPWEGSGTPTLPTSPGGIDAVGAWEHLAAAGRPGAKGVTVAVLDTGIAYRAKGSRFRRSPDFTSVQFVEGYDFVDDDPLPLDENGHGTHVAGTIGEKTGNGVGLTGLAYGARLMPVRVLDRHGRGQADDIAKGIRFAAMRGADVINMSFNFGCGKGVPDIDDALRLAYARGVVTVASVGNLGSETCVVAARHRPARDRRRRHDRGGMPGRLLAGGGGDRRGRAWRRRADPRLPVGVGEGRSTRSPSKPAARGASAFPATTSERRWRRRTSPRSRRW